MKIYGDLNSGNCLKVKYVCDLLGLTYDWAHVDILKGETKSLEFLKINPAGQIPVVDLGNGRTLSQSNAIMLYLAHDSGLIPSDRFELAQMHQWLFWEQYTHEKAIAVLRFKRKYLGLSDQYIDPSLISASHSALNVMDDHLQGRSFFTGSFIGLADLALFAYTNLAHEAHLEVSSYSNVSAWLERCRERLP